MYKRVLMCLFLVQLLSAQKASMRIGTFVVSNDRGFTSDFNGDMRSVARYLGADLERLRGNDLKRNVLTERDLDVLVFAIYENRLSAEIVQLLRNVDETKDYSAVILWVTRPGFFGKPTLPKDIDAVGGASAESPSKRLLRQEIVPRLQKLRENLVG